MKQMLDILVQLSDSLDKAGKIKCANLVDDLIQNQSVIKVAQYVGVIGYVLKQRRAMDNCIRKKRVASDSSMQEVVMDCLSEYQDGQSYGTNDWTNKYAQALNMTKNSESTYWTTQYAQVIEQTPEHFETSCIDFLETIAEENKIGEHVKQMENAQRSLEANNFGKTVISSILNDLDTLLKEGDVDHRPFKVAAPQSERSFWSRMFSPSWTRRGKDKDTKYEMDNVSESIANVSSSVQQIRSNISRLRYLARTLPDEELAKHVNGLSATDWNETVSRMQNISQMLNSIREQNPSAEVFQTAEILSDLSSNVQNIYDQGSRIQRNMYNLRQREPVKGRGSSPAATNEYADLERALTRLYANPLDEKSLYYSHKLHGRLEDALNMRSTSNDREFGQWANEPMGHPQEVEGVSTPEPEGVENPGAVSVDSVTDNLKRMNPNDLEELVRRLRDLTSDNIQNDSRQLIEDLITKLSDPSAAVASPAQEVVSTPESSIFGGSDDDFSIFDDPEKTNVPVQTNVPPQVLPQTTAFNVKALHKMADEIEPLDADLAKLLHEYLQEEDLLPDFPKTSPILKEDAASRLKLTRKKGGKIVMC